MGGVKELSFFTPPFLSPFLFKKFLFHLLTNDKQGDILKSKKVKVKF